MAVIESVVPRVRELLIEQAGCHRWVRVATDTLSPPQRDVRATRRRLANRFLRGVRPGDRRAALPASAAARRERALRRSDEPRGLAARVHRAGDARPRRGRRDRRRRAADDLPGRVGGLHRRQPLHRAHAGPDRDAREPRTSCFAPAGCCSWRCRTGGRRSTPSGRSRRSDTSCAITPRARNGRAKAISKSSPALAEHTPEAEVAQRAQLLQEIDYSIHFHVFTPAVFAELLNHCRAVVGIGLELEALVPVRHEFVTVLRATDRSLA